MSSKEASSESEEYDESNPHPADYRDSFSDPNKSESEEEKCNWISI